MAESDDTFVSVRLVGELLDRLADEADRQCREAATAGMQHIHTGRCVGFVRAKNEIKALAEGKS